MDFTTNRNKGYEFLKFYVLVMRCESDTLEGSGAIRRHGGSREMENASVEPDMSGRHGPLLMCSAA